MLLARARPSDVPCLRPTFLSRNRLKGSRRNRPLTLISLPPLVQGASCLRVDLQQSPLQLHQKKERFDNQKIVLRKPAPAKLLDLSLSRLLFCFLGLNFQARSARSYFE